MVTAYNLADGGFALVIDAAPAGASQVIPVAKCVRELTGLTFGELKEILQLTEGQEGELGSPFLNGERRGLRLLRSERGWSITPA